MIGLRTVFILVNFTCVLHTNAQTVQSDTLLFFDETASLKYAGILLLDQVARNCSNKKAQYELNIPSSDLGFQYDILLTQRRLETAISYLRSIGLEIKESEGIDQSDTVYPISIQSESGLRMTAHVNN